MNTDRFLQVTAVIAVTTATIVSVENAAYSVTFNAANDFSDASNPNGVWQYGFSTTLGGTFTLYTSNSDPDFPPTSLDVWNRPTFANPSVFHNFTSNQFNFFTVSLAPNQLAFHPGPNGEYSIVRWIAPQSGNYSLATTFSGADVVGTTTDVHILRNNTSLFSGSIVGFGNTRSFSSNLSLAEGDILDFAVGFGGNGYSADSTGLSVIITSENTPSVPEPSSVLGSFVFAGSAWLMTLLLKGNQSNRE